ncbi:hypothetical protein [Streptomyces endophytica]|uniref:Uncharacterized protein n=1 Tax=Streptomyces endophytica TaxID=2991496 RepID=A0ABY6PFM8_9ACTN|nr:hypothetical protein [Streptomyces endophytica]UZJ32586.1 hypothetical protein OJ254_22740 [Streptomyces endophytica]
MKILHVLVGSELGALGPEIAEYLADAGHFVYLLAGDPVGSEEWRKHFTHNASVVDEDGLAGRQIDCVVGLSGALRGVAAPVLAPEIQALGKTPAVDCYLRTPRQEALLRSTAVLGAPSLSALRRALLDVCVDAVIHLSREGAEQLEFVPRDQERPMTWPPTWRWQPRRRNSPPRRGRRNGIRSAVTLRSSWAPKRATVSRP